MTERPEESGVFVDFDGTLAPIVDDPDRARPAPGTPELLASLADRYRRVAVISGRPVAYLAAHLAGAGDTELIGLYGLERAGAASKETQVGAEAEGWRATVEAVARRAESVLAADAARFAGVGVERKGLTVTLHYRGAPSAAVWVESFAAQQAESTGLVPYPGKMSIELRPPVATDKGTVVAGLAEGLSAVCYLGDDAGDLPAFEVLKSLREQGLFTVSVAVRSGTGDETPAAVVDAGDLVVDGPEGAVGVLRLLAGAGEPS